MESEIRIDGGVGVAERWPGGGANLSIAGQRKECDEVWSVAKGV